MMSPMLMVHRLQFLPLRLLMVMSSPVGLATPMLFWTQLPRVRSSLLLAGLTTIRITLTVM